MVSCIKKDLSLLETLLKEGANPNLPVMYDPNQTKV
jgi:hypothetical protein